MSRRSAAPGIAAPAKAAVSDAKDVANEANQDKQRMLLADDAGHFSMIRALHLADVITCMNCFCGFMSIIYSMRFAMNTGPTGFGIIGAKTALGLTGDEYWPMWISLVCMPLGLFFDFFDGKVARWRHKSSLMGQELDSLADLVSFGVAPASAAFALGLRSALDTLLLAFFVVCALTRLARFNVTVAQLPKDATGKSRYFEGFPAPTSLSIVGWMSFWVLRGWVLDNVPSGVVMEGTLLEIHPVVGVFVLWGCLMVSRTIHIPKP